MIKNFSPANVILIVFTLVLASCATKEEPVKVPHQPTQWDHEKIREVRQAEAAQTPAPTTSADDEANCLVMTRSEISRSKATGCRAMDPRSGHGEDAFCCPKK